MASLRELRRKVKSVKNTQQITKAMKMVAAARLRKAQARIQSARPFALAMEEMLSDVLSRVADANHDGVVSEDELNNPFLKKRETGVRGVLLVTADKGLCGSFNSALIKKTVEFIKDNPDDEWSFFCVGRKGRDFCQKMGLPIAAEYTQIFNQLSYAHAELIGDKVINFFQQPETRDVTMIYSEFKSVVQQKMNQVPLLPLSAPSGSRSQDGDITDFIYEPQKDVLLESLFPRYLKGQVFRALLESYASEMGARMSAMESASKNARELIDGLTLSMNKIRQAAITKEISELVAGAEALQ